MICVGCGEKIKSEPYWVGRNPFCSEECAALGVDDEQVDLDEEVEDYVDDAEDTDDDYDDYEDVEYQDFEEDFKKGFQDEYEEYN